MSDKIELSVMAQHLKDVRDEIKKLQQREKTLRDYVVREGVREWEGREHLLPTTTITVPDTFWVATGFVSVFDFVESRFPTWDLITSHQDAISSTTTLVLRKSPEFMPFQFEDDLIKVSKVAVEPTPEIDQESLKAERPDLYDKLYKPVTVMELDEQALSDSIHEDPKIPSVLMRHQFSKREPQQRISTKEVKDERPE